MKMKLLDYTLICILAGGASAPLAAQDAAPQPQQPVCDANGCTATDSATLTQPTAIVLTPSSESLSCNGEPTGTATIAAAGGVGSFTYNWSPGSPAGDGTPTVTGLLADDYSVTVTDANNCTAAAFFTLTQPQAISATVSSTQVSCHGDSNGTAEGRARNRRVELHKLN